MNYSGAEQCVIDLISRNDDIKFESKSAECWLEFIKTHYRVVRLNNVEGDTINLLQGIGLSEKFISICKDGSVSVAKSTLIKPRPEDAIGSYRTKLIAEALNYDETQILNPFTGMLEVRSHSLGREAYCGGSRDKSYIASQMGGTMVAVNLETVWIFPNYRLICYVDCYFSELDIRTEVAKLYQNLGRFSARLKQYLKYSDKNSIKNIAITDFSCPHISHNLWNIQTGWANIWASAKNIDKTHFCLYSGQNFFGSLEELYPEIGINPNFVNECNNDEDIFETMLSNNYLMYTVKDEIFSDVLVNRIVQYSKSKCSQDYLKEIEKFKSASGLVIITTIRLDNRAWIEQQEGIPALFSALYSKFGSVGLILDGLSNDTPKGWTTGWMSLDAELNVANAVRAALPSEMPVMCGVGRTFHESLTLMSVADLFIAPSGTGMAFYKWIFNLPGLAFSNRSVLDEASPLKWPLRVWHDPTYRHDITLTEHLSHELVTDSNPERDSITRANFHLNWKSLYEVAERYISEYLSTGNQPKHFIS